MLRIAVTGGAGYIGSALVPHLINQGHYVTVLDNLSFGGDSLLSMLHFDRFSFIHGDIFDEAAVNKALRGVDAVIHLAAIVGFPACNKAGRDVVWRTNVEGVQRVCRIAEDNGCGRFIFASSYSNYGESLSGALVTEESPLTPKSLYAESKIEAENWLLNRDPGKPPTAVCLRLSTLFGLSPRTRFDLMVNQFVLDAFSLKRLTLYQQDFKRSFVHLLDVCRAISLVLIADIDSVKAQVFNVGSERLNCTKRDLVDIISRYIPSLHVEWKDLRFEGDMRSIHVCFDKIRRVLAFEAAVSIDKGVEELVQALKSGMIRDPENPGLRNHPPLLQ